MRIIGFHGPAGAGKSTAANIARRELASMGGIVSVRRSFADCIRAVAAALAGERDPDVYLDHARKKAESPFEDARNPGVRLTNREYLQKVGEMIRTSFSDGILRATEMSLPREDPAKVEWVRRELCKDPLMVVVIFDDVRMPEEARWIRERGGVVLRIAGPDRTGTMSQRAMLDATARALPMEYTDGPAIDNRGDIAAFEAAVKAAVRGYFGGR